MKYFVDERGRKASHSSCYFEFQRGRYHDRCWLDDSISISNTVWDELRLSELFGTVLPTFDYFGINVVTREQWERIVEISQKSNLLWSEVIAEVTSWVEQCFEENEVFSVLGM